MCEPGIRTPATTGKRTSLLEVVVLHFASYAAHLAARVCARPRGGAVSLAVITLVMTAGLTRLRIDNRIEGWSDSLPGRSVPIRSSSPDRQVPERSFVTAVRFGVNPTSRGFLEEDRALTTLLGSLPGIDAIESVSGLVDRLGLNELASLGDAKEYLLDNLIAREGGAVAHRIWLAPGADARRVVGTLKQSLAGEQGTTRLVGTGVFNATLDERSRSESALLFPFALVTMTVLLALLQRSVLEATLLAGSALVAVVWCLGGAGWLGVRLDLVCALRSPDRGDDHGRFCRSSDCFSRRAVDL